MLSAGAFAEPLIKSVDGLKPGEFTWHPERAPEGQVAIVVSLPDQRVYVYRNGVRIAVSTCSTGKPGHGTPTGVFTILQKDKNHHSSTYNNAPMPNMNRLTWSGIALHAGNLPGYPASHGCVRLPLEFSAKLFGVTHIGTPVIIADAATYPNSVVHPGWVLSADAEGEFDKAVASVQKKMSNAPGAGLSASMPVTSIVVSGADEKILVLENGKVIAEGKATIKDGGVPLGNHVFVLSLFDTAQKSVRWRSIRYYNDDQRDLEQTELTTINRIRGPHDVVEAIRTRMYPGTTMVTVDLPLDPDTRTGDDFVVMAEDET
ncbi:MAG: L,D-transpeptidase [Bauldia sp.]|nr:L,D-transpeptidase [Bauldia sp.]